MSRRGLEITMEQAQAHAERHGYRLETSGDVSPPAPVPVPKLTRKDRMTRPEREMSMILEAKKRRGEIVEWRFEGISFAWGLDPKTGKQMWYTADFFIQDADGRITLIETKGSRLFNAQLVRFRGCRATWPQFNFELHQLAQETWTHVE